LAEEFGVSEDERTAGPFITWLGPPTTPVRTQEVRLAWDRGHADFREPPFWATGRPRTDAPDKPLTSQGARSRDNRERPANRRVSIARQEVAQYRAMGAIGSRRQRTTLSRASAQVLPRRQKWWFAGNSRYRATARRGGRQGRPRATGGQVGTGRRPAPLLAKGALEDVQAVPMSCPAPSRPPGPLALKDHPSARPWGARPRPHGRMGR
jgi:hypothetical protein